MAIYWGDLYDIQSTPATNATPAQLAVPWVYINPISPTEISVVVGTPSVTPGSYGGAITSGSFDNPDITFVDDDGIFHKATLTAGTSYQFRVRCYTGANATGTYGEYYYYNFTMPKPANVAGVSQTVSNSATPSNTVYNPLTGTFSNTTDTVSPTLDTATVDTTSTASAPSGISIATSNNKTVTRSLFEVTSLDTKNDTYSLVEKVLPFSTSSTYYSFGTSLFFQSSVDNTQAGGGIGFFTGVGGSTGYFILINTTTNAQTNDDKSFRIVKVVGNSIVELVDSQESAAKTITGIYGATSYKVDVKVMVSNGITVIEAYINNVKITATDVSTSGSSDPKKNILPITNRVAMFANKGKASFDYIYAIPITKTQYESTNLYNIYTGQFGNATIDFLFGEKVIDNMAKTTVSNGVVEEFGTVARELRNIKIKYEARPGYPLYPSTGISPYLQVLGSRLSAFGADVYVLNNAGTFVPLDDSGQSSFSIIGNYIVQSGQQEYSDATLMEYSVQEPVAFESTWIQNESDAKSLSDWIKNQWSKQQQVVDISVFGNPLISVGDVIAIKYASNSLDGSQKFVVTNVTQGYSQGLETTITARSIYS